MSRPRIAVIAGAGRFPFAVAREARRQGLGVVGLAIHGWADPRLTEEVDAYEEVTVGQLGTLIARLKAYGIDRAIMAGKVTKDVLLDGTAAFDADALAVIQGAADFSVPTLLGAVGKRLAADGIVLLDSSVFLKDTLCPAGVLTARGPTPEEETDIRVGMTAARAMAALDVGQTVVVKRRVIIAVEALEGTDATIRRAHQVAGQGLVMVKMASPTQDRRFDLPVIGPETIATNCGIACIAVEAGQTLLLDREALLRDANTASLCIIGVTPPAA